MLIDIKNPNKSKRSVPMQNVVLVDKVTYKDGCWQGGRIYDPTSGKSYKVELRLNNNDLEVKGMLGIFHRTMHWKRL